MVNNMHSGNMLNDINASSLGMQQMGARLVNNLDLSIYQQQRAVMSSVQMQGLGALGSLYGLSEKVKEESRHGLSVNAYRSLDWDFSLHMQKIEDEIKNEK